MTICDIDVSKEGEIELTGSNNIELLLQYDPTM